MRIFLSYASEDRDVAESIRFALIETGHHSVFFDRTTLRPAEKYNSLIQREVRRSDLMVFLISPDSIASGSYTRTELILAEDKWEHPRGHLLPVVVRPTSCDDAPRYLTAVTWLEPPGNVAADVAHAVRAIWVRRVRRVRRRLFQSLAALAAFLVGIVFYYAWFREQDDTLAHSVCGFTALRDSAGGEAFFHPDPPPFETGWIFVGYISAASHEQGTNVFGEGPYTCVVWREDSDSAGLTLPRTNDVLAIVKRRQIIIPAFRESGLVYQRMSPARYRGRLIDDDYTGAVFPGGSLVKVRELSVYGEAGDSSVAPPRHLAVWARVVACDPGEWSCRQSLRPRSHREPTIEDTRPAP